MGPQRDILLWGLAVNRITINTVTKCAIVPHFLEKLAVSGCTARTTFSKKLFPIQYPKISRTPS